MNDAVIFLMGPTTGGKTSLAVELVRQLPLEIISVDSAMVYRGMDIGTAKPAPEVLRAAPHRLIDICEPTEAYSAGRFREDALAAIEDIRGNNRIPLLVGGTGLYFRTLEQGVFGPAGHGPGAAGAPDTDVAGTGFPGAARGTEARRPRFRDAPSSQRLAACPTGPGGV